jgi:hypothetical protein
MVRITKLAVVVLVYALIGSPRPPLRQGGGSITAADRSLQ